MPSSTPSRRFAGNIVVVTGAANGIGRGVAAAFVGEGAIVYGFDIDSGGLEATRRALTSGAGKFNGIEANVAKADDVLRNVDKVLRETGRVDVLVNNAGINMAKRLADLEIGDWDRVFDTNLKSVYLMCKAVWPGFQSRRAGNIVNVASIMGQVGGVGSPAYCSTKASIIMLSRCLAKDGAQYGIRVNSVCPGYIDTPIMERQFQTLPDPVRARQDIVDRMPLGRMGIPEDVAAGILFLASTEAAYISGSKLTIDGAVTATQID